MELSTGSIVIAVAALLLAGFAKGISGMGIPLIATPILALLLDLQTAIAIAVLATFINDIIFMVRMNKNWALVKHAVLLLAFGIAGTALGSYLLVHLNQFVLAGSLGVIILAFVVTSFFSLVPTVKRQVWLDTTVGLLGGTFQGTTGACGPIIGMYLLQMKLSRNDYLFLLNCFFVAIDCMQLVAIYKSGCIKGMSRPMPWRRLCRRSSGWRLPLKCRRKFQTLGFAKPY